MPTATIDDLARMRDHLLFDGDDRRRKLSRFWALLLLSAVIASAGVVADSTATVIGAMIVAPLMVPIMGTVLAVVTGDQKNLTQSVAMVVGGAAAAIGVGYLFGVFSPIAIVSETSSQVASRVSPRLIDLIAALATGAVGAFAQCRADVSDTLPGVAIAISLVPPLAVVGLTLEGGQADEALGALLLFLTNVAAILVMGCIVMALFGVHRLAVESEGRTLNRRNAALVVVALVLVVAVPLAAATAKVVSENANLIEIADVAAPWARDADWRLVDVSRREDYYAVRVAGPLPAPDTEVLAELLEAEGLDRSQVVVYLEPEARVELGG
jgi:uncharacterized hydrophobic protein (TIGR00271 family)